MNTPRESLSGIAAITITPFGSDQRINEPELRRLVALMDEGGADTIFACGGLAEYYSLSLDEKRLVTRITVSASDRAAVYTSVGLGIDNAVTEAQIAKDEGAEGIMIHPPPHPYVHPAGLAEYYRRICEATPLAVVAYIKDSRLSSDDLEPILRIENVVGVKYAGTDVRKFGSLVDDAQKRRRLSWICGSAEAWAPYFWMAGAVGFTSGIANFAVRESVKLRDALRDNDLLTARESWSRLRRLEDLRGTDDEANSIAVIKAATALCGLTSQFVRPPLRPLPASREAQLIRIVKEWDLSVAVTASVNDG